MFDNVASTEHGEIEILYDAKVIGRDSKMYGLYMVYGCATIGHALVSSRDLHDNS